MNDELLVERVRQYEELYNMSNKKYNDNIHKDKLWKKIAKELNTTGPLCKSRWISLRDQFRKALKKKGTQPNKKWRLEDNMSFIIPFYKEREAQNNMSVYENSDDDSNGLGDNIYVQNDNSISEDAIIEVGENDVQINQPNSKIEKSLPSSKMSTSRPIKLMKFSKPESPSTLLMKYLPTSNEREFDAASSSSSNPHPIDLFFKGLAATVKNFSPEYQHIAKSKLFTIVSELEWAQLQHQDINEYQFDLRHEDQKNF